MTITKKITFDDFMYETMYVMFALFSILFHAFLVVYESRDFWRRKFNYVKNIIEIIFKKVFYIIIFSIVNANVTMMYLTIEFISRNYDKFVSFKNSIIAGVKMRREIINEMNYYDDFGGEEDSCYFYLQRPVSC